MAETGLLVFQARPEQMDYQARLEQSDHQAHLVQMELMVEMVCTALFTSFKVSILTKLSNHNATLGPLSELPF